MSMLLKSHRVSADILFNMLLVLSITFNFHNNIWGRMCSTFPNVFICFRGCVSEMFVTSYSVTYYIYIIRFGLEIVFACLYITPSHYHHFANLSENVELIKCLSDIFCRVCE